MTYMGQQENKGSLTKPFSKYEGLYSKIWGRDIVYHPRNYLGIWRVLESRETRPIVSFAWGTPPHTNKCIGNRRFSDDD